MPEGLFATLPGAVLTWYGMIKNPSRDPFVRVCMAIPAVYATWILIHNLCSIWL